MSVMALTKEVAQALAMVAKEAADSNDKSNSDIRSWLADALRDARADRDGYGWCYLTDFIGDAESGTVYFCCDGDLTSAPYSITQTDDTISVEIDMSQCVDVVRTTTYKREGMPDMTVEAAKPMAKKGAAMAAKFKAKAKPALKKAKAPKPVEEDDAPMEEAGARHSKVDQELIQSIHEHSIALGAVAAKNDNNVDESAAIEVLGDAIPLREGAVGQDGTAFLKLISPGWGSSGFYSEAVLERDGPKVFTAGTKDFWDHQTAAEEAARPEGSLRDLASVLTEDAHYDKNGPTGPGLYARAKVFEQFRQPLDDLAKHIGVSIRAMGKAKEGKAPDGKSGKIIEQLTQGISVDYVTTPGAGGEVLQLFEAARGRAANPQQPVAEAAAQENPMDVAELRKLQESNTALQADLRKLRERQALVDASGAVADYFRTVQVSEAIRERVTSRVLAGTIPMTEAGDLDSKKVKEFAEAQLTDELSFLRRMNPSLVSGMNTGSAGALTEGQREEIKARKDREQAAVKESDGWYLNLMGFGTESAKRGRKILIEGRRSFDPNYNARERGALVPAGGQSIGLEG